MTRRDTDAAAEAIAAVAIDNWRRLLRIHRHRLAREDLEDCLAQATFELITLAIAGDRCLADREVIRVGLARRLESRIIDRRRALAGRSPITAAIHHACPLQLAAGAAASSGEDPLSILLIREQLASLTRVARESLTSDQRLVLRSQLHGEHAAAFCAGSAWTLARYYKTAQRARARLRALAGS